MDPKLDPALTLRFDFDAELDSASKLTMVPMHLDPDLDAALTLYFDFDAEPDPESK